MNPSFVCQTFICTRLFESILTSSLIVGYGSLDRHSCKITASSQTYHDQRGGSVVGTVAVQQEGPGFEFRFFLLEFACSPHVYEGFPQVLRLLVWLRLTIGRMGQMQRINFPRDKGTSSSSSSFSKSFKITGSLLPSVESPYHNQKSKKKKKSFDPGTTYSNWCPPGGAVDHCLPNIQFAIRTLLNMHFNSFSTFGRRGKGSLCGIFTL